MHYVKSYQLVYWKLPIEYSVNYEVWLALFIYEWFLITTKYITKYKL